VEVGGLNLAAVPWWRAAVVVQSEAQGEGRRSTASPQTRRRGASLMEPLQSLLL